jgi:hypothetical protein
MSGVGGLLVNDIMVDISGNDSFLRTGFMVKVSEITIFQLAFSNRSIWSHHASGGLCSG